MTRDGILMFKNQICIPDNDKLKKKILTETHNSLYGIHPSSMNMYHSLKGNYWWNDIKKDKAEFVAKCLTCQQVKAKHQPLGSLQPRPIPKWKWERITIDFVFGLPRTQNGHDSTK